VLNLNYFPVSTATMFAAVERVKLISGEDVSGPAFTDALAALHYEIPIIPAGNE
jgi:hypothetical protein